MRQKALFRKSPLITRVRALYEGEHFSQVTLYGGLTLMIACYLVMPGIGIYDNIKELSYLAWQHQTLQSGQIGGYWWFVPPAIRWYPAISVTHAYSAMPETTYFSPLTPLLLVVSPAFYLKLFVTVHALLGVAGTWLLARRLRAMQVLTTHPLSEVLLAAALIINPFVFQHISVGYLPWATFWFLPWLLYFSSAETLKRMTLGCGAVLGLTLLEGGIHSVSLMLPVLVGWTSALAFLRSEKWRVAAMPASLIVAIVLALPRLVATARQYGDFNQSLQPGFRPGELVRSIFSFPLTWGSESHSFIRDSPGVPSWDGVVFWGPIFLGLLAAFGLLLLRLRRDSVSDESSLGGRPVIFACGALVVFATLSAIVALDGSLAAIVNALGSFGKRIESAEKYPFRFAVSGATLVGLLGALVAGRLPHQQTSYAPSLMARRVKAISSIAVALVAVGILIHALDITASMAGELGPADPKRGWTFMGFALLGVALLLLRRSRTILVEVAVIGVFLLSIANWQSLATSKMPSTFRFSDPQGHTLPTGVTAETTPDSLSLSNANANATIVEMGIPVTDARDMDITNGGAFVLNNVEGADDLMCPAERTCVVSVHLAPLWPFVAISLLAWAGVIVHGVGAKRRAHVAATLGRLKRPIARSIGTAS